MSGYVRKLSGGVRMVFGRYPEGAWEVPGRCLYVSGRCLCHVQYVSGGCLGCPRHVWKVYDCVQMCPEDVNRCLVGVCRCSEGIR